VQYYAPWFRHIAAHCPEIALTVLYATRPTAEQQGVGFGEAFRWDVPLEEGYESRVVRPPRAGDRIDSGSFFGLDVPEITDALAATRPQAVLLPGWHSATYARAHRYCRRYRIPVLYRGDSNLLAARRGLRGRLWRTRTRYLLHRFSAWLATGTRAREYLRAFDVPEEWIFAAPHAVDNERFAAQAARFAGADGRSRARQRFGLDADAFVVLFA